MKFGVDISCYDNNIDYATFRQNIQYAIIRVGYGVSYMPDSQRDTLFDRHYSNLKGYVPLGAYYYAYATNYDQGRKEAENCLAYMGDKTFELPIFYDLEESRNTYDAGRGFVDRIREAGLKAGVYCSTSFYKNKFNGIDCDCLWLAEYGSNNGQIPSSEPRYKYDIWQYSSKGSVAGWNRQGDVDTAQDYVIDGSTPTPTPTPVPDFKQYVYDYQVAWNKTYGARYNTYLEEDGIFGPETEKSKNKVYLKNYMENPLVEWCQRRLKDHKGYDLGKYGCDGKYGNDTERVVRQFQIDNQEWFKKLYGKELEVDGIIGYDTITILF